MQRAAGGDEVRWERDLESFRFTRVGTEAERLLGYSAEEWLDQPFLWIPGIYPEDRERVVAVYTAVRGDHRERSCDYRVLAADGSFVWLREAIGVARDAEGRPKAYRGTLKKIAAPALTEETPAPAPTVAEATPAAAAPADLLPPDPPPGSRAVADDTLRLLATELRGPVTSILGWIRLLRGGELDEAARVRALDTIEESAASQARLLDALLDLAAIERGELRLRVRPVDVALVVHSALNPLRATAAARGVTLRASVDASPAVLSGDEDRLAEVVSSVLATAIDLTPRGGRVDVQLEESAGNLRLRVSGGEGSTDAATVTDLLEPPPTTLGVRGIRLAIAARLARLHGGTLRAEGDAGGRRLVFTVGLPLAAARGDAAA